MFYSLNASIVGLGISSDVFEDLPSCVGLGKLRFFIAISEKAY